MKPESTGRLIALAALYFLFGTILTIYFIARKYLSYESFELMILSGSIAGGKWLIQLIAALILLREQRWIFIKNIGFVCLIGSAVLFIYFLLPVSWNSLVISVAFSVLIMIFLYYRAVKQTGVSLYWFWGWMVCLLIAIMLQLTLVFDVI